MRNKGVKLLVSLLIILSMILPVAGCGGSKNVTPMDKEHVYSYEDIKTSVELDDVRGIFYNNDRIYVVGTKYEDSANTYLCSVKPDGTDPTSVQLKSGYELETTDSQTGEIDSAVAEDATTEDAVTDGADMAPAYVAENETAPIEYVYTWLNRIVMDTNTYFYGAYEINRDYVDENGEYMSEGIQALVCWNDAGEIQWSMDLAECIPDEYYFYINTMLADNDNTLWIFGGKHIMTINSQGELLKQANLSEDVDGNLMMEKDGTIFTMTWNEDYTKQFRQDIDKNTLTLGAKEEFPDNIYSYNIIQEGTKYDFILSDSTSIYAYNMGDAEPLEIMDTVDSDLYSGNINNVCLINDTQFVATYSDPTDWCTRVALFTKVPAEEVKDKTAIVMSSMYMDYDMRKRVVDFNKTNDTYRIQINEYNKYATADDYLAGYTRLNTDIVSGNVPDILILDSQMPVDSYIAKGLIADLNPLIDNDPEINRDDYLANIFEAFSQNGKMYQLVPAFEVSTVIGKTSIVGDRSGWNMQEFREVMAAQPEGTRSFYETTKDGMLYTALVMTKDEFIDADTGACHFDSPGFVELLEFVNEFPSEIDYSAWDSGNYWMEAESVYRENRAILLNLYLYTYHDFNRVEKGQFGEDINIIGFPTESRNGNAIIPSAQIAISAKSGCQEGAWEFIRYYLTDEYQDNIGYMFPIKKSALAKMEKEAMDRPYWEDEEGNKEYYDDTYWINEVEVAIDPMTQEEASELTEFLSSITLVGSYDQSMMDIVTEEAQAFFEGQKSAQEVADIIQSRMKIYVSESR